MRKSDRSESPQELRRRKFLGGILKTIGAAFLVFCIYPIIRYLSPRSISGGGNEVEIPLDEIPIGESKMVNFSGKPVILIRTAKEVIALSAICTHLGCIVQFNKAADIIHCPCHGAQFDIKGNVLKGPATIPLESYPTTISGKSVFIRRS